MLLSCPTNIRTQRLGREARVWHRVKHQNVLEFFGVVHNMGEFFALVSPYCAQGNVGSYLETYPQADRLHLVIRVPQFTLSCTNLWLDLWCSESHRVSPSKERDTWGPQGCELVYLSLL